jgi:hypothetical protein
MNEVTEEEKNRVNEKKRQHIRKMQEIAAAKRIEKVGNFESV